MTVQDPGGPTALRLLLGGQLRRLRTEHDITCEEAARRIRCSPSKIRRLELGQLPFRQDDLEDLLTLYGVRKGSHEREAVLTLARDANTPGWWQRYDDVLPAWNQMYVGLESAASRIRTYEVQFIPGLLQTEAYARAVISAGRFRSPDEIDRRIDLRIRRQKVLTSPDRMHLWTVIDEGALRRPIGGRQVMREQLEHLLALRAQKNVTVQIMPFRFGHVAEVGAFSILRFPEPDLPDMVYLEHLTGALYLGRQKEIDRYNEVFDRLIVDSQTPQQSAETLSKIIHRER